MQKIIKIINQKQANQRIDRFICNQINNFSRGEIIQAIKNQEIKLNNKKIKPSTLLKLNDEIEINIKEKSDKLQPNSKIKLSNMRAGKLLSVWRKLLEQKISSQCDSEC